MECPDGDPSPKEEEEEKKQKEEPHNILLMSGKLRARMSEICVKVVTEHEVLIPKERTQHQNVVNAATGGMLA